MSLFRSTEEALLQRCRAGDESAWTQVIDRYEKLVYSIPRRGGLNQDDAADVFQATFLALYRALDKFENADTLPKWLAVVATRETWRIRKGRDRVDIVGYDLADDEIVSGDPLVETEALNAIFNANLREGLAKVPEPCRSLITMLYMEDLAYDEIGKRIGMPIGSIGPTRARCLARLKTILERAGITHETLVSK